MHSFKWLLGVVVLLLSLPGVTLSADVKSAASRYMNYSAQQDAENIIRTTHPLLIQSYKITHAEIIEITGAKNTLREIIMPGVQMATSMKYRSLGFDLGEPSSQIKSGKYTVCVIPVIHRAELAGKKTESHTYLLGIQDPSSDTWRFISGSWFELKPKAMDQILPGIRKQLKIPKSKAKQIR